MLAGEGVLVVSLVVLVVGIVLSFLVCSLPHGRNMATHALFETSTGYAIFEVKLHDVVGALDKATQASIDDYSKFSKMVSLMSFAPFQDAAHALENMNDISESAYIQQLRLNAGEFTSP